MSEQRMTYRERREAKAERYREWAEKREAKATSAHAASCDATAGIPFGQPILVGHHSQRRHERALERARSSATAALDHSRKADEFLSRADNIEAANAGAIYSDDHDAIERLTEKLAGLEAEREAIKAYNVSCRKAAKTGGTGDVSLLTSKQRAEVASIAKHCPYQLGKGGAMPSYALSNMGGVITNTRKRIEQVTRQQAMQAAGDRGRGRKMAARYGGSCAECGGAVEKGDTMTYYRTTREVICEACDS